MNRRNFIALVGGAAAAWPVGARAQQNQRNVRVGILMNLASGQSEGKARVAAFVQAMALQGWVAGRNAQFDIHWSEGNAETTTTSALALVAAASDVIVASGGVAARAARRATSTTPIIFAQVTDPVGGGLVTSLAAPGGNATGFTQSEFGISGKWLGLLKELTQRLSRVAVIRSSTNSAAISQFAVIQALAQSLGIEIIPASPADENDVDRVLANVARGQEGGLIVVTGLSEMNLHQTRILALAARHRVPAVYPYRFMVEAGGLASYGADTIEPYRKAAQYVDRVLKGEKPADLPVQASTKFETVINLRTARTLGFTVPPTLLARADEVIE